MKAKISERGQITLPKTIRVKLGLRPGTMIDFTVEGGKIIGTKSEPADGLRKWRGKGKLPGGIPGVDEYLAEIRG